MANNNAGAEDTIESVGEMTIEDGKKFDIDEEREASKTFLKIAGVISILAVVTLVIVLPVYFEVIVVDEEVVTDPSNVPESDRFNCMPEGDATAEECKSRGCIWAPPASDVGVPSCFYDDGVGYQRSGGVIETPSGYQVNLVRTKSEASPYGQEFDKLTVDFIRMSNEKLRIKIYPTDEKRFEIPWVHQDPVNALDPLYDFQFINTPGDLFTFKVTRKDTGTVLFDTSVGRLTFADQFVQISTKLPSEHIYGFGEHMHETWQHDLNWKTYGMFSRDQGVGPGPNLYGVHPFYMCMEGDGNAHGVLFLNSNAQDVTLQPAPALTYRTIGGLLDIYMFVGPSPEQVVQEYTGTIGRPYMPPYWALGFQLCRYGYGSLDKLKKVVDRNLAADYPYDVQYSDIDYMDRQLDFTINQTTYAGLEDFVRDLKSTHSMKYIIILDPAISGNETAGTYPPFDRAAAENLFIRTPSGDIAFGKVWPDLPGIYINTSLDWDYQTENYRAHAAFPDFLLPETVDWWRDLTVDFYKRIEFDGLWIDMNEPASFVHGSVNGCPDGKWDHNLPYHPGIWGPTIYDKTTCMSHLQYNPVTDDHNELHYNMHSLYGWSQSEPTLDACRSSTGERCMVISRSTFPGSGKYVGHWLGDNTSMWEHLRASIIGMLEFNLFGIPYIGADICGFFQDTTEELCMRWTQLGAFYPFMRNHNGLGFKDQDPAVFGSRFVTATKKIHNVRYQVLPHFYTLFHDAHVTGSTVIRSLMAEFPMDLETYAIQEQLLLGGNILLSPALYEDVDSIRAYVPDARWYDYYTGAEVPSGARKQWTYFSAPWDHMPIHVRGGAIIPIQHPARTTELQRNNGLGLIYALNDDMEGSGHLFWDDGNSIDTFENGVYTMVTFTGTKESITSSVQHNGYEDGRSMMFDHVIVMGVDSDQVARVLVNRVSHSDFTFDPSTKTLRISGMSLPLTEVWQITWDTNEYIGRHDCHPGLSASQSTCEARGCMWVSAGVEGVPWCFFPENYGTYKKDSAPEATENGEFVFLERLNTPTFYSDPVQRLKFEVEMHSEYQLRIKISDPNSDRYEVPMPISGKRNSPIDNPMYEVIYQDEPFGFKVVRRSSRQVIMDTSVGALIFEDQYIQMTTKAASTYLYGLGEFEHANYANDFYWTTQALHARDEGVKQFANLYGYHPYHMTMENNGDAHGVLLLTSNAMEVDLTPMPSITYRTIGGVLDFYIFLGPTPELVTQQYSQAIGLPMMPPYWSLGFQLCKYGYGSLEEVQKVVEGMKEYDIPLDVQYGDIDYMERQLDFTVDPVRYAGLAEYVDKMRDEYKMRYVIILDPAISANETMEYPAYTDGVTADVFIRDSNGKILYGIVWPDVPGTLYNESTLETRAHVAFPDFLKPETHQWWSDEIWRFHEEQLKFDGLWIDMNEPTSFELRGEDVCPNGNKYDYPPYMPRVIGDTLYDKSICMSAKQYSAKTTNSDELRYNVHSLYGWSQAEPTMAACRNTTGKRCYVISRSTYPGAGKYAGHWLGDNTSKWPHLRASIIGMFEFSLFGFPYSGADICGFFEDAQEEMCLRWSQLGAFYPFSRNHAMLNTRRQDPAAWGPEFAASVRKVLLTRYTLLPYLYTLFYHSHTKGSTVVRPLLHEFTDDMNTWNMDNQMLWGPALLISPVLEAGKTDVDAYFPNARWFDYYSGMEVPVRGSMYSLAAPKDHINLHVRGGYIVPTQEPANTTYFSRQNAFGLIVALDDDYKATSGDLYWDDGDSIGSITDKQYTMNTFTSEGNVLENRLTNDGYSESNSMLLETITIFGLRDVVTAVYNEMTPLDSSMFSQDAATNTLTVTGLHFHLNTEFMLRWELNNEWSRFDCMPDLNKDADLLVRSTCESRGCVWQDTHTPGVPRCFHNVDDLHGYHVSGESGTSSGGGSVDSYTLHRKNTPTLYGDDIAEIKLDVEYQTDNRLHFKISDPNNNRYEVPEMALQLDPTVSSDSSAAKYQVEVIDDPFSIKVTHKGGNVVFDSSVSAFSFADQFLQISTSLPSLNVYGFGEHNHRRYRHDLNWRRWAIFTRDVAPVDDWNLYGHHTFYMAMESSNDGKSYGVYLHNSNAMDVTLQPTPALTYRVIGGVLDFYLFVGDSPEEVVREYHQLIGNPVMPPYWGLGFQLSRWNYGSLDRVKEVVSETRAARIPFDIQYGDIDYMDSYKSFTYDHDKFAGLPEFVDELHNDGMRYVVILDPGIKIEEGYGAYDSGIEADIFIKDPTGSKNLVTEVWPGDTYHPDYTAPNVTDWWYEQCRYFYEDLRVHYDALWIDMNEPANFQPDDPVKLAAMNCTGKYNFPPYMPRILWYGVGLHDKTFCMDNQQHLGLHYDLHSLYGHTMSISTYDTLKMQFPDKRSFLFSRSTFAGSGKYGGHWTGDNQSQWRQIAWSIPIMFEFNLFGFAYVGADICGFWYNTTSEMCQRWTQVGAFYPFSRNHNANGMIPQHPSAFGTEFENAAREILEIRYSILPYMYTLFYEVHTQGGTLVRALVHEFPSDRKTWDADRQFLLGPAFLVTPVMDEGATEVTGYFPAQSRWFDFRTGAEVMNAGKFISLDAPLDYIPLHVRGGYIIPMQNPDVTTNASRKNPMSLLVALDAIQEANGTLFWDDGEQRDMSVNFHHMIFTCIPSQLTITVDHTAADLPEISSLYFESITVYGQNVGVSGVTVDGINLDGSNFTYDATLKKLTISGLTLGLSSGHTIKWS